MKAILLLLLCLPAYAALPPMPAIPAVKRPAPWLSPKAASVPKSTPMARSTAAGETSLSTLAPTRPPVFETNLTIIQIDGSQIVRDKATIYAIQRVGKGIRVEYSDSVMPTTWEFLADWAPYVEEQIIVTERYTDPAFRAQARFFRVVEYTSPALLSESGNWILASGLRYRVNPAITGVRTWSTKR